MRARSAVGIETLHASAGADLRQVMARLEITTSGPGFYPLNRDIDAWLAGEAAVAGLLTIFIRHTSASLTIQENADPDVLSDLADALDGLAPRTAPYRHNSEGPDDMPAHIRTMLSDVSLGIPVITGRLDLGTWQDVYLVEHRDRPHRRTITLHYSGS